MIHHRCITAVFVGLLLVVAGCSSSDSNSNPLIQGNSNDANYLFMEEVIGDQSFEGIELSLDLAGQLIDSIPGATPARRRFYAEPAIENGQLIIQSINYSYQNTWHIFQVTGIVATDFPVDTFNVVGIDSIQILNNGSPQQVPDDNTNAFAFNAHLDAWSRTTSDSLSGHHQIAAALVDSTLMSLDGDLAENIQFTRSDSLGTCDVHVANTFQASGIVLDLDSGGCPQSGSIVITSAVQFDCQGGGGNPWSLAIDGLWTVTGTYNGQNESYTFTDGTNVWSASEPCGGSSPIRTLF